MLTRLRWLGLQVKDLDAAHIFYGDLLDLTLGSETEAERRYAVGPTELRLKLPDGEPSGGIHTHYAFSTSENAYADWRDHLAQSHEVEEHDFGIYRSAYCFDPDDHCVEIAGRHDAGEKLQDIFEVVLEVASLERAERYYRSLDMDVLDRGSQRTRVRLDAGPFELELWEPQRGLAGARGGAHVDLGLEVRDLDAALDRLRPPSTYLEELETGYQVRDPDGHTLTLLPSRD